MKEAIITSKTAKLAKEKNFTCNPNDCGWSYLEEHGMAMQYDEKTCVLRPTQSLLKKWLREIYSINIEISNEYAISDDFEGYSISIAYKNPIVFISHWEIVKNKQTFKTYEEALEEGLYQALKLIKN